MDFHVFILIHHLTHPNIAMPGFGRAICQSGGADQVSLNAPASSSTRLGTTTSFGVGTIASFGTEAMDRFKFARCC